MTRLAILLEEGFQDEEVIGPRYIAEFLGWKVDVLTPRGMPATGKHRIKVLSTHILRLPPKTDPGAYDVVIIPGGWQCPEKLRQDKPTLEFVRGAHAAGKIIAAICHGPWVLASAGLCKRRHEMQDISGTSTSTVFSKVKMTCYPGMKDDLVNAGSEWVDQPVVRDGNVITAQHYRDVPEFMRAIKLALPILQEGGGEA